jgi:hypothetical protein
LGHQAAGQILLGQVLVRAMRPPIVVFAGGDVDIFESIEDAVRYIEWPSIVEDRAVAYDSEGRLLKLEAPGERATGLLGVKAYSVNKPISITGAEVEPSHQDELGRLLRDFLERVGTARESVANAALGDLLRMAITHAGFTR